jgi:hypothetical protein
MKQLFILLLILCSATASAQDVIVKKDGSTVVCRVVELNASEIIYKKWTALKGANYVINRSDASAINYEDGRKVYLSESSDNLNISRSLSSGTEQMNDKELLNLDRTSDGGALYKYNRLKKTGLIGGIAMGSAGVVFCILYPIMTYKSGSYSREYTNYRSWYLITGLSLIGAGAIWTTSFLVAANSEMKKYEKQLMSAPIYQQEFKLGKNSTLSAGIDMLRDQEFNTNTLGLGLRCNF